MRAEQSPARFLTFPKTTPPLLYSSYTTPPILVRYRTPPNRLASIIIHAIIDFLCFLVLPSCRTDQAIIITDFFLTNRQFGLFTLLTITVPVHLFRFFAITNDTHPYRSPLPSPVIVWCSATTFRKRRRSVRTPPPTLITQYVHIPVIPRSCAPHNGNEYEAMFQKRRLTTHSSDS